MVIKTVHGGMGILTCSHTLCLGWLSFLLSSPAPSAPVPPFHFHISCILWAVLLVFLNPTYHALVSSFMACNTGWLQHTNTFTKTLSLNLYMKEKMLYMLESGMPRYHNFQIHPFVLQISSFHFLWWIKTTLYNAMYGSFLTQLMC